MKTNKIIFLFCIGLLLFSACEEETETEDLLDDTSSGGGSGYWAKHNNTGFIHLSGSTAKFCMESTREVWTGSYNASLGEIDINLDGQEVSFEVAIDGNTMTLIQYFSERNATETVYYKSSEAEYPCGSSGNSGNDGSGDAGSGDAGSGDDGSGDNDGGDSGSGTGNVTFYLTEDIGCGFIEVTLAGNGSKTISKFYTSNPGCDAVGSANFYNLEYGSYEFSATSDEGCTWNSDITVDRECQTMRLHL